jgi:hypothetical protein
LNLICQALFNLLSTQAPWLGGLEQFLEQVIPDLPGMRLFLVAFGLGFALPVIINRFYKAEDVAAKLIKKEGSEFEKLLWQSINGDLPLGVTLKSLKFYVGWPVYTPSPKKSELEDIRLLPIASGFRDKETHQVTLTTNYHRIFEKIEKHEFEFPVSIQDFEVVFPVDEILSTRLFSLEIDQYMFSLDQPEPEPREDTQKRE